MGRFSGKGSRVYFDEFDISGVSNAFDINFDVDTQEVTAFADPGAKVFVPGNYSHTFTVNAFNDSDTDAWDGQLFAILGQGSLHQIGAFPDGATQLVDVGYEMQQRPVRQPRHTDLGSAATLNGEWQGDSRVVRATVLNNSSITSTGVKTGVNVGANASGVLTVVTYRILAVSGAGNIVIALEESQNDGGGDAYAAVAALASGTLTGVGVTRKTTTGAIEAWNRINVTTLAPVSATIMVTVGPAQ